MHRGHLLALAVSVLVILSGVSAAGARSRVRSTASSSRHRTTATTTTTTTTVVTTTTGPAPTTTTTAPPAAPTTTTTAPAPVPGPAPSCAGVAMTQGQPDIDANPPGTTFCLAGTHAWTLTPKAGDALVGPAVLDGGNAVQYAIQANANNVNVSNLEIRNYRLADQQGAIHVPDPSSATGWVLSSLQVHDNGTAAGGSGANLGDGWRVEGGRYYNNRQEGLGGQVGDNVVVDGVELDHNDFTNDSYTTRNISCGYEAGGFKWVANNVTVQNSSIHDNACKGLWSDINANGITITGNQIYNNWDEGIFIEISSNATISGNTVTNNGWHNYNGGGNGCPWLFGGGITLNSSDHVTVTANRVTGNCNGITGVQQDRPDGHPGLLEYFSVLGNTIAGPGGVTGVAEDNGANLALRSILFANNTLLNGMPFCGLNC
jgi:parallel beta-helix repeat protein